MQVFTDSESCRRRPFPPVQLGRQTEPCDTKVEQNNLFFVNLTSPVNGVFGDNQGRGDILNDD